MKEDRKRDVKEKEAKKLQRIKTNYKHDTYSSVLSIIVL